MGHGHSSPHKSHPVLLVRLQGVFESNSPLNIPSYRKTPIGREYKHTGSGWHSNQILKKKSEENGIQTEDQPRCNRKEYNFGFQNMGSLPSLMVLYNFLVKITSQRMADRFSTCIVAIRGGILGEPSTNYVLPQ